MCLKLESGMKCVVILRQWLQRAGWESTFMYLGIDVPHYGLFDCDAGTGTNGGGGSSGGGACC